MAGFLSRIIFFLLLGASAAMAAPAMPHDLVAPERTVPDAPTQDMPASDADDDVPQASVINSAPLAKPSIDGFGTMDPSNGGLSPDIWHGSTRESAGTLLHEIHSGVSNPVVQKLLVSLLMTQANPPLGTGENWFVERVDALVAMGQDDKAEQMIASLPPSMSNDSLKRTHVELTLLRGDTSAACKMAAGLPDNAAPTPEAIYWQKVNILCKAVAGKQSEVMIGLDVLREQNKRNDMFFQEAVQKINDKTVAIKNLPKEWTLFDVTLMRLAKSTEQLKDKVDALPPASLKYIAQDTSLDLKLREKATLRSEQLGIVPIKEGNKTPELPFTRALGSDVTTLVTALGSDKPANSGDDAVIARLALDEGSNLDNHRVQRLLTLMEPFGYTVPPAIWQKLFAHRNRFDGDVPAAKLVAQITEAAHANKKGEVILLAGLILGGTDTDKQSELALSPVVNALKAIGYEKDARHLAYSIVKSYSGK